MNRLKSLSRGSLVLAAVAVAGVAIWAATAHTPCPCHRDVSPPASSTIQPGVVPSASTPADPAPAAATHTLTSTSGGLGRAGMMVAIDPETGELVAPTAEQAASLQPKSLNPADAMEGLEEIHHSDGSVSVSDISGRFMQYEVVRIGPDGTVRKSCVQGADEAAAAVRDTVTRVVNTVEVK
jgi:hypothetical protein